MLRLNSTCILYFPMLKMDIKKQKFGEDYAGDWHNCKHGVPICWVGCEKMDNAIVDHHVGRWYDVGLMPYFDILNRFDWICVLSECVFSLASNGYLWDIVRCD